MTSREHQYICSIGEFGDAHLQVMLDTENTLPAGAVLDALIGREVEALTQALEEACNVALDWLPGSGSRRNGDGCLHLRLRYTAGGLVESARLELPAALLLIAIDWNQLRSAGIEQLDWAPVSASLCLGRLQLSVAEQSRVGPGAMVLLPESFTGSWPAALNLCAGALTLHGRFSPRDKCWSRLDDAETPADAVSNANGAAEATHLGPVDESPGSLSYDAGGSVANSGNADVRILYHWLVDAQALFQSGQTLELRLPDSLTGAPLQLCDAFGNTLDGHCIALGEGHALLLDPENAAVV